MIYLDPNSNKIILAEEKYFNFMNCKIHKKLGINCIDKNCSTCKHTRKIEIKNRSAKFNILKNFVLKDDFLRKILIGNPIVLKESNDEIFKTFLTAVEYNSLIYYFKETKEEKKNIKYSSIHELISDIKSIFNYDWFSGIDSSKPYSAYHLAANLNIRSCVYCNRTYTTTIRDNKKGKLMRPQFDHWFPKSKFPLLSLSFYNLIPSCYTCNSSVKGDVELSFDDFVHPYIDKKQTSSFAFNYYYDNNLNNYKIIAEFDKIKDRKAYDTVRKLKIDKMYNAHIEELKDLIKIKQYYSDTYIKKIQELFPDKQLSKNEIYRLLFGTEMNSENFDNKPLSKFKNDILKKLNII